MTEEIASKVCTGCEESKPIFRFRLRKDRPGEQRHSQCIDCEKKRIPYTAKNTAKREAGKFLRDDPWGHKRRAARRAALKAKNQAGITKRPA